MHNFFPFPTRYLRQLKPGGDLFSLSSLDPEERSLAVAWSRRTVETAHDLEAGRVVLHCGRVATPADRGGLHALFRKGAITTPEGDALRGRIIQERDRHAGPHLDALKFSLEALLRTADRLSVRLGLENRYYYRELPGPEEMATGLAHLREAVSAAPE